MSFMMVPGLGRNLPSSSAALAKGVETDNICVSCADSKGRTLSFRADRSLYFLGVVLPEVQSEYVNIGETSSVMLWHRHSGHINAQSI